MTPRIRPIKSSPPLASSLLIPSGGGGRRIPRWSVARTLAILLAIPCASAIATVVLASAQHSEAPHLGRLNTTVEHMRHKTGELRSYVEMVHYGHREDREGLRVRLRHLTAGFEALEHGGVVEGRVIEATPEHIRGLVLEAKAAFEESRPMLELLSGEPRTSQAFRTTYPIALQRVDEQDHRWATLAAALDRYERGQRRQLVSILAGVAALNLLVLGLGLLYAKRRLIEPLNSLQRASAKVGRADFDTLVNLEGDAEVEALAEHFNAMTKALERQMQNLEIRREELETTLESLPHGVAIVNASLAVLSHNQAFRRVACEPVESIDGSTLGELMPIESVKERLLETFHTESDPWSTKLLHTDHVGQHRSLSLTVARTSLPSNPLEQEETCLLVCVEDRTLEDALRNKARAIEASYRSLIERTPDAVAIHRHGRIVHVNPAWLDLLGYDDTALLDRPLEDLFDPSERPKIRRKLGDDFSARTSTFEATLMHRDGSRRIWELLQLGVEFDGEPATAAIGRDISERKRFTSKLMEMDRMAAVGTLAAGVGHEINNPLAYVVANIEHVLKELPRVRPQTNSNRRSGSGVTLSVLENVDAVSELEEALTEAREGAMRVRDIVAHLKVLSPNGDREIDDIDFTRIVRSSASLVANAIRHRAKLELVLDDALPPVSGNEAELGQVVVNLLSNAADAITDGPAENHTIRVRLKLDGARLRLEISDTGTGIPNAIRSRIFDPFFTTKPVGHGTGLGLTIARDTVEKHGGEIHVAPNAGGGTCFTISLPVSTAASTPAPTAPLPVRSRLLIIDDEPLIGRTLIRALGDTHDVVALEDPRQALELLREGEQFDLILSDLIMPEMTGMALYDELLKTHPTVAEDIVFMTGNAFASDALGFLRRVPNTCIDKPFQLRRIEELLRHGLAKRQGVRLLH